MTIRDKRQKEFADIWLNHGKFGILNLCPRFGKIRTTIHILNQMNDNCTMLIAYPDNKIKDSWIAEFELMGYINENITYTTHRSIEKHIGKYDLVVIDEIHLLSEAQLGICVDLFSVNDQILGLTGTLSKWTKKTLYALGISVIAEYPIHKAIEEGVIADYQITVVQVPLDNSTLQEYTKKNIKKTELQQYKYISGTIRKMMYSGGNSMFARLARMRIIQNSLSKREMTKRILTKYKDERILVFCGITKIADALGIPSHHSKSKDKEAFTKFAEGEGNHMAVVKIGNTGVTYKPLNKVIINYFDSNAENLAQKINRCMAMEYDTPDKKSQIYIISSNEPVELKWLEKALEFFDKTKVKYV